MPRYQLYGSILFIRATWGPRQGTLTHTRHSTLNSPLAHDVRYRRFTTPFTSTWFLQEHASSLSALYDRTAVRPEAHGETPAAAQEIKPSPHGTCCRAPPRSAHATGSRGSGRRSWPRAAAPPRRSPPPAPHAPSAGPSRRQHCTRVSLSYRGLQRPRRHDRVRDGGPKPSGRRRPA